MRKRRHDGRLKDPNQVPSKKRSVYLMRFWFELPNVKNPKGNYLGLKVAVRTATAEKDLKEHEQKVISANQSEWFRPKTRLVYMGRHNGKDQYRYEYVRDIKTGNFVMEAHMIKTDAVYLGADI